MLHFAASIDRRTRHNKMKITTNKYFANGYTLRNNQNAKTETDSEID